MIDSFLSVSDVRSALDVFGLDVHPTFAKYCGPTRTAIDKDQRALFSQLEDIVYRQDLALKYKDYRSARVHHLKAVSLYDAQARPPRPKSERDLLLHNAPQHFRSVHKRYRLFTVPLVEGFLPLALTDLEKALRLERDTNAEEEEPPAKRSREDDLSLLELVELPDPVQGLDAERRCFSVLSDAPGRMKHIGNLIRSSGAPKLNAADIAITMHTELANSTRDRLVASMLPMRSSESGVHILCNLNGFDSVEDLQNNCSGWTDASPDVQYGLHGMLGDADMSGLVHQAVKGLYKAGALPGTDAVLADASPEAEPWRSLLRQGYVSHEQVGQAAHGELPSTGFRFTEDGVASVDSLLLE